MVVALFFFYYNTHYFLETKDRNAKNLIHTNLNHFPPNIVYVKHNASNLNCSYFIKGYFVLPRETSVHYPKSCFTVKGHIEHFQRNTSLVYRTVTCD